MKVASLSAIMMSAESLGSGGEEKCGALRLMLVVNLYVVAAVITGLYSRVTGCGPHGCPGPGGLLNTLRETCSEDVRTLKEQFLQLKYNCDEKIGMTLKGHKQEAEGHLNRLRKNISRIPLTPGPLGHKGIIGAKGDKGDIGIAGDMGQKGVMGEKGVVGESGETGDNGTTGWKGSKGDEGMVGPKGMGSNENGEAGDTGSKGQKGETGDPGTEGVQGSKGSLGDNGDKGLIGDQGPTGDKGMIGTKGVWGNVGPDGGKGDSGDMGTIIKGQLGIQGMKGDKGEVGDKGEQGMQGSQGDKGDPGETGEMGVKGQIGDMGAKGEKGQVGELGDMGDKGEQRPPGVLSQLATTSEECNKTIKGHVKYDEMLREVLYCNGYEWILLLPENISPGRFELFPALSCQDIHTRQGASATSGVYWIRPMPKLPAFQVYCDLNDTCGDEGGWTLVMKMNGSSDTAEFYSPFWIDKQTTKDISLDLSKQETKLPSFWTLPFTELCLGMANESTTKWISLPVSAASLLELIEHGRFQATTLGIDVWQSLLSQFVLPTDLTCDEGFNVQNAVFPRYARIGIIASDDDCDDPSHVLGFGINGLGTSAEVTVGGSVLDTASTPDVPAFGFILAR